MLLKEIFLDKAPCLLLRRSVHAGLPALAQQAHQIAALGLTGRQKHPGPTARPPGLAVAVLAAALAMRLL